MQRILAGALLALAMTTSAAGETITFEKSTVGAPPENFELRIPAPATARKS